MTQVEPQAGTTISLKFTPVTDDQWVGEAFCQHGSAASTTFQVTPGVPPLNHAQMVSDVLRNHALRVGCNDPLEAFKLSATVSYGTSGGISPGELRIIPEASASIAPPAKNFTFFGRLMCARSGAFQVVAKIQLAMSVTQGAIGQGRVLVAGNTALAASMADENGKATANLTGIINVHVNEPVALAFDNTSGSLHNVTFASLEVYEVWTPGPGVTLLSYEEGA